MTIPVPISVASSASIQIQKCGASLSWHMIFAHWAKYDKKKFYNWYVIGISVILGDHQSEF